MTAPRIALIHALRESQIPAWNAFAAGWPEAKIFNLLDDSLPLDLPAEGELTPGITERFRTLGNYAAHAACTRNEKTQAILFTCSAFGPALDAVKRDQSIPVLRPNEAAFETALESGQRIALMTTFPGSLPPLVQEINTMARERNLTPDISTIVAEGALQALQSGNADEHDRIAARTAATLNNIDVLVLCQFSLARAAKVIAPIAGRTVVTTPASAVAKLKCLLSK
jgi:Asp/Glu/hydantoin racemase